MGLCPSFFLVPAAGHFTGPIILGDDLTVHEF